MMIGIASALNYVEFDEIKDCKSAYTMWNKIKEIYGGDDNVKRAKFESLIGQFYQMKMREYEILTKQSERIKLTPKGLGIFFGVTNSPLPS